MESTLKIHLLGAPSIEIDSRSLSVDRRKTTLEDPMPDINKSQPQMLLALTALISRMLVKDRARRIGTVHLVAAELEAIRLSL